MFECQPLEEFIVNSRKNRVDTIRDIKIVHRCASCNKVIKTHWETDGE